MTSAVESTGATTAPGVPGPALARLSEMPRVDLMPAEIAAQAALRRLQVMLGLALVASVAVVGGLYYQGHSSVNHAKQGLANANAQQLVVQGQVSKLSYVSAEYADVASAKNEIYAALGGEVLWSKKLNDLSLSIPANVWLTSMAVTTNASATASSGIATVTYQGVAMLAPGATGDGRDNIANWLDSLGLEKGYIDPYVTTTPEGYIGRTPVIDFTSTVTVTSASLSDRYTPPNGL